MRTLVLILILPVSVFAQSAQDHLANAKASIEAAEALLGPTVTFVPAGGNLAEYVAGSVPGAVLALSPGGVYTGPITLTDGRTLTTAGFDVNAPVRAVIGCPAFQYAVNVTGVASIRGVRIECNGNDLVLVQSGGNALIEYNQIYGAGSAKKGITSNGGQGIIRKNDIDHIYRFGQETHGISILKGGPWVIDDNDIKAASVNLMSGGDSFTEAEHPHDLTFTNNRVSKRPEWRGAKNTSGQTLAAKNLFELKAMDGATITGNTFTLSYLEGQDGVCISLSVRNQYGNTPFATVRDIEFANNVISQCGGAVFSILAQDYAFPSQVMDNVRITNTVVHDFSPFTYGGIGRVFYIEGGPTNLQIEHLTVHKGAGGTNSIITFSRPQHPAAGFVARSWDVPEGAYGIQHTGTGWGSQTPPTRGTPTLTHFFPGYVWENVTIRRVGANWPYPAGTTIIPQ